MSPCGGKGGVVLLHGHGRLGASLHLLARAARRSDYATLVPGYRFRRSLEEVVAGLAPGIRAFADRLDGPLHFVTHSLGGLVARALIARSPSLPPGRLVMLGPPNGGSELADLLFRLRLDRALLGRVGGHLRTIRTAADEEMLGRTSREIGIIAGDRALDPILPRLLLPRPNDGKVSVAATRLDGMADHLVLPVTHTLMVYDRRVIRQTLAFLEQGRFVR